ncbi:UNVERIFIED_CONTAM: hypothetical protein Sradi_4949500 [Sesamum radiatum]|uniref:Uncharacterized protein n=1 Tax=Sesamum radiatum TaxID=300843 RepID=A0AAW2MF46_SESRA
MPGWVKGVTGQRWLADVWRQGIAAHQEKWRLKGWGGDKNLKLKVPGGDDVLGSGA